MPQFIKGEVIFQNLTVAPGGIFKGFGAVDPGGRIYYVNNITGSAGNDGLSWNQAFDEVSSAITASETFRQLGGLAPTVTTNDYIRNTIVVQGTATAYTALTAMGSHVNILGLGDNMLSNVTGIARIGADSGVEEYAVLTTTNSSGLYLFNMQFSAGAGAVAVMKFTTIFRSTFESCGFSTNGNPGGPPDFGLRFIGAVGGLHIKDCHWGNGAGTGAGVRTGISIEGSHWHICLVEGCHITGSTAGVHVSSSTNTAFGSVFKNNYIGADAKSDCTIGINDDVAANGDIIYMSNFINATTATDIENGGTTRSIGNMKYTSFVVNT